MSPSLEEIPANGSANGVSDVTNGHSNGINGNGHSNGTTGNGELNGNGHATPKSGFRIWEQPAYTQRKLRVVVVGAGYSGLTFAHKIQHEKKLEDVIDLQIYEKNSDVGGTWFENTYPGAACDIPSHGYTFLFEPNPNWSKFYVGQPEIHAYIKKTAEKWNLLKHVSLNSKLIESIWDDDAGKWKIKVNVSGEVKDDEADILINGTGFLNKWKWPSIAGLNDFKGKLVHSANWDNSYDWHDKRVAVIGNGSSGVQVVAAMQAKSKKLVNYVRNPTWISINFCADKTKDGHNFEYTDEERKKFNEDPKALFAVRKELEASVNAFFFGMVTDHPFQQGLEAACKAQMTALMKDHPELAKKMIPGFHPGCRRLTPGDGYLEAVQEKNCSVCWSPIQTITGTGIRTSEGEEEFDLIVCATGFDTSFIPPWNLVGLNGATLNERWKQDPDAFFAVQVDGMPNYFMFNGPNCPISHGSVLTQVSWTSDYILRWAKKIATQDIKSITPKAESVADFNEYSQEFLQKRTVWGDKCNSWYKNGKSTGTVTGTYAGSILHFKDALENMGSEHFDIVWRTKNRFRCLGNGQSVVDENGMGNLAYYMEESPLFGVGA